MKISANNRVVSGHAGSCLTTRAFSLLLIVVSCHAVIAMTAIPTERIQVGPTNAADHDVLFSYGQTNDYVTVVMPYTKGEQSFDGASIECTNATRRFSIPVKGIHPALAEGQKDVIVISFRMERQLVRECTLRISFAHGSAERTEYILSLRDFVPAQNSANQRLEHVTAATGFGFDGDGLHTAVIAVASALPAGVARVVSRKNENDILAPA